VIRRGQTVEIPFSERDRELPYGPNPSEISKDKDWENGDKPEVMPALRIAEPQGSASISKLTLREWQIRSKPLPEASFGPRDNTLQKSNNYVQVDAKTIRILD